MKRHDHKYLAHSSQLKAHSQIINVAYTFWGKIAKFSIMSTDSEKCEKRNYWGDF
jgi:hypothetical protein